MVEAAVVATGVALLVAAAAGALALDGADDELVPLDELEELEELDELDELEPDELLFDPDPFDPPSGSVYCWSPADGPDASAAAGTRHAIAQTASRHANVMRCTRTVRVLQDAGTDASAAGWRVRRTRRRPHRPEPATIPANACFAGFIACPGGRSTNATGRVRVLTAPVAPGDFDVDERRSSSRFAASMTFARTHTSAVRALLIGALVSAALLASNLVPRSAGDLQGQIDAGRSAASSLQSQIAAETARIRQTTGGLQDAQHRLAAVQAELISREAQLRTVQEQLLAARDHLVELENRLQAASKALAANLVAAYENNQPDLMTVILESHGFADLLEKMSFLRRIGHQDAQIVGDTRSARAAVFRQATELARLEQRDRSLTNEVLAQRNQVAALQAALLNRQIAQLGARSADAAKLHTLNARLHTLEARAAAAAAAAARNAVVGGIRVDVGGMVQPPPGAPAAVAQVIAAGNAIATLPYIWGGGHGSFQASGYDCSGSVSYALAAAGLLSSPLDSTGFESWGLPGPGRWITVYANAGHAWMEVAGWRFDTVALASGGTRWSQGGGEFSGFVARHPPGL